MVSKRQKHQFHCNEALGFSLGIAKARISGEVSVCNGHGSGPNSCIFHYVFFYGVSSIFCSYKSANKAEKDHFTPIYLVRPSRLQLCYKLQGIK